MLQFSFSGNNYSAGSIGAWDRANTIHFAITMHHMENHSDQVSCREVDRTLFLFRPPGLTMRATYEGALLSARNNMITVSTFCTHD